RDGAADRFVRHRNVPDLGAATDVGRRRPPHDALALARAAEEVGLELDRREALVRLVVEELASAGSRECVGERDHRGREEEAGAGDEWPGHVDVAYDFVAVAPIEDDAEQARDARAEELVESVDSRGFFGRHPVMSGTGCGGGGPTYSALGRISRLSAAC